MPGRLRGKTAVLIGGVLSTKTLEHFTGVSSIIIGTW